MKKQYKSNTWTSFSLLLFLFIPNTGSHAQNPKERPSSIFWEITNPKTGEYSYLYGSFHIQDKKVFSFDSIVWEKMNACKSFVLEMELDKISPLKMMKYIYMDSTYDALLSPENLSILKKALYSMGIEYNGIKKMHPFFLSMQISLAFLPKDMAEPLDSYFLTKARKNKMKVIGIESLEDQMRAINSISIPMHIEMMMANIQDISKEKMQVEIAKLMIPYLNEDSETLWNLSSDTTQIESNAEFVENFLLKRNRIMADAMDKAMQESTLFTVIGAAHLGGSQGVVALLQKKGYRVLPLKAGLKKN